MRIAVISVAPVFSDYVIGGSQKILADVAAGLRNSGHDVQIWCTGTAKHSGEFELKGVPTHPELMLRGSFPATHQVSPVALARTVDVLKKAAAWADRVYLHADAIYLREALDDAEIVRSIHDLVYEEALLSTLTLPTRATIVPSAYLKRCVEATVALAGRKTIEPVIVVPNGIQVPHREPQAFLPPDVSPRQADDLILLFPHRPEPTKGVREAISSALQVQRLEPTRSIRLLMPLYPPDSALDEAANTAQDVLRLAHELGAVGIVELHRWLGPSEMPGYLAAGDVTLCVGSFIESFGLVPIESVVNGTPAVCARVGAMRQFDDIDGITLLPQGDISGTAEAILLAATECDENTDSGRDQIISRYSSEAMITGYESAITGRLPQHRSLRKISESQWELAPWCDVQGNRIYDDYAGEFRRFTRLTAELKLNQNRVSIDSTISASELNSEIDSAISAGILVPQIAIE